MQIYIVLNVARPVKNACFTDFSEHFIEKIDVFDDVIMTSYEVFSKKNFRAEPSPICHRQYAKNRFRLSFIVSENIRAM